MQITDAHLPVSPPRRLALRDPGLWFVLATLVGTTLLHYLTDIHLIPYHSIYRSLYYVPIAVAAVRYGRRGGVMTALTASLLYIPHVVLSWETVVNDGVNDLMETLIFLFVGAFAGSLADAERRQRQRAQEATTQLTTANVQLQAQAALAERMRASIASILESIDSGVITLDRDAKITTMNRAASMLLDTGDSVSESVLTLVRDYLAGGASSYQQVALTGRVLGLHGSPLVGAQGERIGTVLVLDDLTERRALEEQVQRAQRLAALGRLAGGLAHEIRNPLAITRAAAQLLQRELEHHEALSEYSQVIQSEIDRVDRLVEQLLAYARPLPFTRGAVDIKAIIERTLALTRAYAAQQGITLALDTAQELPAIEGDAELLHQALVNLLLNGVQATSPGGIVQVQAEASPQTQHNPSMLVLTISDTGCGIAPDDLLQVFDPFFTTRADGTGLGLSIVQQIAHEHGGTIEAQSQPGSGTRMMLRLPASVSSQRK